ncbi:MAG TPA: dihydropteroate synthase [Stellaceae bacterium]|nr:dihydropteroate synthase [Stellaceae bacterium]
MASSAAANHTAAAGAEALHTMAGIAADRLWLRPAGLLSGAPAAAAVAAGLALPLAGAGLAFSLVEILVRRPEDDVATALVPVAALRDWARKGAAGLAPRIEQQLERLTVARPDWAGLPLARPLVMGIVNVTPDSFSDGGDFFAADQAIRHGRALLEEGADILDVGGESTRPGATPVPPEEEFRRVEPVVRALAAAGAVVSIDTRHASVMAAALEAGARIINDVSALAGEPESLGIAARSQAPVVLMHMPGDPRTMQDNPSYTLASLDVLEYLARRVEACLAAGIPRERIVVDPGIGFGKHSAHNLEIMARLALFQALGCGVMLGLSRKGLIGSVGGAVAAKDRMPGSIAGALYGVSQGVQIVRVHDVAATRQALATWEAMAAGA